MVELDEIKKRKLAEMQAQHGSSSKQANDDAALQQKIAELEAVVKQLFTKEALQRYGNIKAVDQEKAIQVIAVIGQMIQSGRMHRIDDQMLKSLLGKLTPKRKDITIRRA